MKNGSENGSRYKLLGLAVAAGLVGIMLFGGCSASSDESGQDGAQGATAIKDLGELREPGRSLGGDVHKIRAGGSLTFRVRQQPTGGILAMDVSDDAAMTVTDDELSAGGGTALHKFTFAVKPGTKPGTRIHLATMPTWSARRDPKWAFGFDVVVP